MQNLVGKVILAVVIITALLTIGALGAAFVSIGASGEIAEAASNLTGTLFALSRVGLLLALALVVIFAALWVDWFGTKEAPPPPPKHEETSSHNAMD